MSRNPDVDPVEETDGVHEADAAASQSGRVDVPPGWERLDADVDGSSVSVLAITRPDEDQDPSKPGSGPSQRARHVLRERPELAREADGRPVLSLTLLLKRQPRPDEESIRPLVERAVLRFDATLVVPPEAIQTLSCSTGDTIEPLYATRADLALIASDHEEPVDPDPEVDPGGPEDGTRVLDAVTTTGTNATASLGATLDREHALAVFSALNGQEGPLAVRADVRYRPAARSRRTVRLEGSWAEIFDALVEYDTGDVGFDRMELRSAFESMVDRSVVDVEVDGLPADGADESNGDVLGAAFALFVERSTLVLRRFEDDESDVEDGRYILGTRPSEAMTMRVSESIEAASERTVRLEAGLGAVFGDALKGHDVDAYISAIAVDGRGRIGDVDRILKRVQTRSTDSGEARSAGRSVELAVQGPNVTTVDRLVSPIEMPSLPPRGSSALGGLGPRQVVLDDLQLPPRDTAASNRNLPVVQREEPPVWPDRKAPQRTWYAPTFEPVKPRPSDDPGTGPFEFSFERTGTTADGGPALRGTLRFELKETMPDEVERVLTGQGQSGMGTPRADPVATEELRVDLVVPYEDEDGPRTEHLRGEVTRDGDTLAVEVHLRNRWVRLAYGALAFPDFQERSPEVIVTYTFEGYELIGPGTFPTKPIVGEPDDEPEPPEEEEEITFPVEPSPGDVVFEPIHENVEPVAAEVVIGEKKAVTPVLSQRRDAGLRSEASTFFDAEAATLHTALGEFQFGADGRGAGQRAGIKPLDRNDLRLGGSRTGGSRSWTHGRDMVGNSHRPRAAEFLESEVAFRPGLKKEAPEWNILPVPQFALATFGRSVKAELSYPCTDVGTLYRNRTDGEVEAIGCRDAFALGKTSARQYEELTSLRHDRYRVHRAVAQPHRFLVVPRRYRIGRGAPGTHREYEPTAVVYAMLDPDEPERSTVVFEAGLQPDLPPHLRRTLRERLAVDLPADGPDPVLEYPTDVFEQATYEWTIRGVVDDPVVVEAAEYLRVSVTTGLSHAHLLRLMLEMEGIIGHARFELADGSTVNSTLEMTLKAMTGPWRTGPAAVDQLTEDVRVTNHVGTELSVSELRRYNGVRLAESARVERTLSPGESATISSFDPDTDGDLVAVYEEQPGMAVTLEESRIYVEEITTNVIFVTDFDRSRRDVSSVKVQARLRDLDGTRVVPLQGDVGKPLTGDVEFTLPLTQYLDKHVLEFRVSTHAGGEELDTGWLERDLRRHGTVVPLSWHLVSGEGDEHSRGGDAADERWNHRLADGGSSDPSDTVDETGSSNARSDPRTDTEPAPRSPRGRAGELIPGWDHRSRQTGIMRHAKKQL